MVHDVVIIGSGPAGYTAAIYTARANLKPILFSGYQPGGQLMITTDVENYPGFPNGITGPELMDLFREQAERFGAEIKYDDVTKADFSASPFKIWSGENLITAKTVIIATGATARWLGLESEEKLKGKGVSACATCDGAFFREKHVMVVGGGDTAMEEANFLTRFAASVTVVHRRDQLRASKIMQERSMRNPKISFIWNSGIIEIKDPSANKVTSVVLKNYETNEISEKPIDGIFIAIGHQPNSHLFKGQLDMNEVGYIITKSGSTATNIPGVFACGDVADHVYRQAISAAGTGCMAAIDAERYLESQSI